MFQKIRDSRNSDRLPEHFHLATKIELRSAGLRGCLHRVRRGFLGLDRDDVANPLQPPLEVCGGSSLVDLIQASLAQLVTRKVAALLADRSFVGVATTVETVGDIGYSYKQRLGDLPDGLAQT
jgi:hypothetical protein